MSSLALRLLLVSCALLGVACAPKLGDSCDTATDCSVNADRYCDRAQPGGYCTVINCEPGDCGDEGYCVRFEPDEPRRSSDWCMARCSSGDDCRDAYDCVSVSKLNGERSSGGRVAEMLDSKKSGKFCVPEP